MYYIYHIPGIKIGCSQNIKKRIQSQKFSQYEIVEEHYDVYKASRREIELQKQYGYKVDRIPYYESLRRITKAQEISLKTKDEWLPNVDWKAREDKVNQIQKWSKVKSHPNYINRDLKTNNKSWKLKKVLLQYDLDGNFIKEWECGARKMPDEYKNAGGVAKNNTGTIYGFQWRYKELEDYSKQIGKFENQMCQKVIQKDLKRNIIKIWDNQTEAANSVGCSTQMISRVSRGIGKTAKGFIWERFV
jgi:hypothetical protein